jgi:hypothetical protein
MASSRVLWIAGFTSLIITSIWWVWLVAGLWSVHWPNNGQQVVAVLLLVACVGILGYGGVSMTVALLGRSTPSVSPVILECVSMVSLAGIVGGAVWLVLVGNGMIGLLVGDGFPLAGLAGSVAAVVLFGRVRARSPKTNAGPAAGGREPAGGTA